MALHPALRTATLLAISIFFVQLLHAHNGKIGQAFPLGNITIDGDFTDWPKNISRHPLNIYNTVNLPKSKEDFSGFFQVGYRMENKSFYIAVAVTDDSFIEDTSSSASWNTQDGLEIYIDARHLPSASGVASFMYTKKLRNINKAMFDGFAKNASWDIMEVSLVHRGNTRYYEWRIQMGDELKVGKSIGIDLQCFDKDADSSFHVGTWGTGEYKYRNPKSLSDIILLPAQIQLSTISGKLMWNGNTNLKFPRVVYLTSDNQDCWVAAEVDSLGNYKATVPAGTYNVSYPGDYFYNDTMLYSVLPAKQVRTVAKPGNTVRVTPLSVTISTVPDLIPEKGVLHDFDEAAKASIDSFITINQKCYHIPGVSLALIKDGKLVYHKTYGIRNTFTGEKVDSNTLFEAASITKPVFAFAVQRLAERGIIDLDKPLYLYLPYEDIAYDERYKLITARHVLTHRTGFPNWRWMNADHKLNLLFTPGTKYNYSGEGFEYLKLVVQKITGKKVEQVLQEEVIAPMKLYHTFFSRNDSLKQMAAAGHYDLLPTYDELPDEAGMAWSMNTEAKVFTNFMLYLLEQKGLNESTYKTMFTKQSEYVYDPGEEKPVVPTYMGMSLQIRETPFGLSFGHGGNNGDFKCNFEVFKDLKMGYVIFTNSNTSDRLLQQLGQFLIEGKSKGDKN